MKIEDIQNYDLHITTKQGAEVINLINKIGIKDQVLDFLGGGEDKEKSKLMIQYSKKQSEYLTSFGIDTEDIVCSEEYKQMNEEEQIEILNKNMSEKTLILKKETKELEEKVQAYGMKSVFNLVYTALIERYYSNANLIEKTLSTLFEVKVKEIQEQPLQNTFAMIKKLIECKDLKACINVFTGALH
ncbi:hypothetical protein CYK72_16040 [Clostridium perfringens]|uniref:hypothetical protein n=1 Tax=Clostridium perfringens TaxID=1502 RepID=UPI000D71073F|nr:hypothetical protein [Clostridium perfringens]MBO3392501.1 hypothetical protein [Clostridium perfringens]PWX44873.1 hypothetical protein CYK72_16040 [Clostridium perfringens]